jgi:tetratricopeptide (TPR) repeat protein
VSSRRFKTPVKPPVAYAPGSPKGMSTSERLRAAVNVEDLPGAADAAMELGPAAREQLPEAMRTAFDAIREAFALYECGQDDPAREKLQAIGLTSPFLDWKLLLRGFIAYTSGDSVRALDNWSRLVPSRAAARLIAPLRFTLDPAFRMAQTPAGQAMMQLRGDRLIGNLVTGLRTLQTLLSRTRLADAFRQASAVLPELKRHLLHGVAQLASGFQAAIIRHGQKEDMESYLRVFGPPADDPKLCRLEAMAMEERHAWVQAHEFWQRFQQSLVGNLAWPAADRDRARALVWSRMGRNADEMERERRRLTPNAEACFKQAIQLAPDLLEPYEQWFLMLRERKRPSALAAGKRLLKQFPDHGPALDAMADLCREAGHGAEALDFARRALTANPFDGRLRGRLAEILRMRVWAQATIGNFTAAEDDLTQAFQLSDGRPGVGLLAQAAAIAFKSGAAELAEDRVRQTTAIAPVAAAYALAAEASRCGLPRPLKKRFDAEFAAALGMLATVPAAIALAAAFSDQDRAGSYTGQKGHEKKVQAFVDAALAVNSTENDLVRLSEQLFDLDWLKLLKKAATRGQKRFPHNPFFPFFEVNVHLADERAFGPPLWKVEPLLEKARRLAENCPPDHEFRRLMNELTDLQRKLSAPATPEDMFRQLFDTFDSHEG